MSAGMSNLELENLLNKRSIEIVRLLELRAELLEALRAAEKDLMSAPHSWGFEFTALPKIRAAIAKAKANPS